MFVVRGCGRGLTGWGGLCRRAKAKKGNGWSLGKLESRAWATKSRQRRCSSSAQQRPVAAKVDDGDVRFGRTRLSSVAGATERASGQSPSPNFYTVRGVHLNGSDAPDTPFRGDFARDLVVVVSSIFTGGRFVIWY